MQITGYHLFFTDDLGILSLSLSLFLPSPLSQSFDRLIVLLQCGSESARTVAYLDIQLALRPFGENTTTYGSIVSTSFKF